MYLIIIYINKGKSICQSITTKYLILQTIRQTKNSTVTIFLQAD